MTKAVKSIKHLKGKIRDGGVARVGVGQGFNGQMLVRQKSKYARISTSNRRTHHHIMRNELRLSFSASGSDGSVSMTRTQTSTAFVS